MDAECLRQIELILKKEPGVAAIIGEPISANPVVPGKHCWAGVNTLCREYDTLLIFDKIIEGFGRTGKMFACKHFLTPDILMLGKSMGGGLVPCAGMINHERYDICPHRSIGHITPMKEDPLLRDRTGRNQVLRIRQSSGILVDSIFGRFT